MLNATTPHLPNIFFVSDTIFVYLLPTVKIVVSNVIKTYFLIKTEKPELKSFLYMYIIHMITISKINKQCFLLLEVNLDNVTIHEK